MGAAAAGAAAAAAGRRAATELNPRGIVVKVDSTSSLLPFCVVVLRVTRRTAFWRFCISIRLATATTATLSASLATATVAPCPLPRAPQDSAMHRLLRQGRACRICSAGHEDDGQGSGERYEVGEEDFCWAWCEVRVGLGGGLLGELCR